MLQVTDMELGGELPDLGIFLTGTFHDDSIIHIVFG